MNSFSPLDQKVQEFQKMFEGLDHTSRDSAKVVVPLILKLLQPKSAIDVGCGVGSWLAVLKEFGVQDVLGVDVEFIDKKLLQIPEEQFYGFDLQKPLKIDRQFDLVLCLEVAGYIPEESAAALVNSLTQLGPVVLFSAPIPFQPSQTKINLQWPEYWLNLFKQEGYVVIDCLRKKIWNNPKVSWWFAQNILLFVRQDYLESNEQLKREFENTYTSQLALVHPNVLTTSHFFGVRASLSNLSTAVKRVISRKNRKSSPHYHHSADFYQ